MRLYNTDSNWSLRKDVRARGLRWTITDTCLSQDQKFLLYASISPIVHLVGPRGRPACVFSVQLLPLLWQASWMHMSSTSTLSAVRNDKRKHHPHRAPGGPI